MTAARQLQLAAASRGDAVFDETGAYRYRLSRELGGARTVCWVMLNPSTADHERDDPTLKRCIGFARALGYGRLDVVNLFALRSSDPSALETHPDPIGPANDEHIVAVARAAQLVICAWGAGGSLLDRDAHVRGLLERAGVSLFALAFTGDGAPRHPLARGRSRIPDDAKPILWSGGP